MAWFTGFPVSAAKSTPLTWETGRSKHERIKETGHYPLREELKFIDGDSHCEQQQPFY